MWLDTLVGKAHAALLTHPSAAPARLYLERRGVSRADWVTYQLGYSTPDILIGECSAEFAAWFPRHWFERIVFPITSPLVGQFIGLQTRAIDSKFYPQFMLHNYEVFPMMFGLQTAMAAIWTTRQVVIVEGVFDFFATKDVAPNTVAILGAGVPLACKRFFRRYVRRVTALLDMDGPGREGASRLATEPAPYTVVVPFYIAHDPADLIQAGERDYLIRALRHTQEQL